MCGEKTESIFHSIYTPNKVQIDQHLNVRNKTINDQKIQYFYNFRVAIGSLIFIFINLNLKTRMRYSR